MTDFLSPRRTALVSRFEKGGVLAGIVLLLAAWPISAEGWLSNTLTATGIAVLGLVAGGVAKDWRWRRLFSRYDVDPAVVVYASRGGYSHIVANIDHADYVDLMGISLSYALEHIRDNSQEFFRRVNHLRILLPTEEATCDGRDLAQGSAVGSLWNGRQDAVAAIRALQERHPTAVEARSFRLQPYAALTRVNDDLWVAPYVTKSGGSSPVLAITRARSGKLFRLYADHFEYIWHHDTTSHLDTSL